MGHVYVLCFMLLVMYCAGEVGEGMVGCSKLSELSGRLSSFPISRLCFLFNAVGLKVGVCIMNLGFCLFMFVLFVLVICF